MCSFVQEKVCLSVCVLWIVDGSPTCVKRNRLDRNIQARERPSVAPPVRSFDCTHTGQDGIPQRRGREKLNLAGSLARANRDIRSGVCVATEIQSSILFEKEMDYYLLILCNTGMPVDGVRERVEPGPKHPEPGERESARVREGGLNVVQRVELMGSGCQGQGAANGRD